VKKRLNEIYAKHTGKDFKSIQEALERDKFMSPEEAKDFGIIDKVVEKKAD
jgi:ATP-dependent Clp protease, protease subunit